MLDHVRTDHSELHVFGESLVQVIGRSSSSYQRADVLDICAGVVESCLGGRNVQSFGAIENSWLHAQGKVRWDSWLTSDAYAGGPIRPSTGEVTPSCSDSVGRSSRAGRITKLHTVDGLSQ